MTDASSSLKASESVPPHAVPPGDDAKSLRALVIRRAAILLVPAVALAFVWQVTPLKQFIEPQVVADALGAVRETWWSPFAVGAASVAGLVLMVPLTLVVLAHGASFDFPASLGVAEGSMLIAAVGLYYLGRRAGDGVVDRVIPAELRAQLDDLGAKGVLGLAVLRWVPVAHFGLLSMSLGALRVPVSRFVLSTALGQTPIVILWVILGDRIRAGLVDPNVRTLGLLFGVMVSVVVVAIGTHRFSKWRKARSV